MTYREYARDNGHSDAEIEAEVGGLFGADAEMEWVAAGSAHTEYNLDGWTLYANDSSHDVAISPLGEEYHLQY